MHKKFARPLADSTFKLIFGEEQHQQLTIDFLNSFLERTKEKGNVITEISFMNQEQTPRRLGEKKSILDIHCKDQSGHRFIIEMQAAREPHFDKRAFFYGASLLSRQLDDIQPYSLLKPVIVIGILEKTYYKEHSQVVSHHVMCDMSTGKQSMDLIELHFIELSKFNLSETELHTQTDKWLFFLKNAENTYEIPQSCQDSPIITEAFHLMERATWTRKQSEQYESDIRASRKELTQQLDLLSEGLQKGIEIGIEKEKEIFAIKLLKKGEQITEVADFTELSLERIQELFDQIKK